MDTGGTLDGGHKCVVLMKWPPPSDEVPKLVGVKTQKLKGREWTPRPAPLQSSVNSSSTPVVDKKFIEIRDFSCRAFKLIIIPSPLRQIAARIFLNILLTPADSSVKRRLDLPLRLHVTERFSSPSCNLGEPGSCQIISVPHSLTQYLKKKRGTATVNIWRHLRRAIDRPARSAINTHISTRDGPIIKGHRHHHRRKWLLGI